MNRQRGNIEIIILGIIIFAAVVTVGTVALHAYNQALTRAERAEANNAVLSKANADQLHENGRLKGAQEATDKLAAERKTTNDRIATLERKVTDSLNKLYVASPEAQKWASTPVPPDVLKIIRDRQENRVSNTPAVSNKPATTNLVSPPGVRPRE